MVSVGLSIPLFVPEIITLKILVSNFYFLNNSDIKPFSMRLFSNLTVSS